MILIIYQTTKKSNNWICFNVRWQCKMTIDLQTMLLKQNYSVVYESPDFTNRWQYYSLCMTSNSFFFWLTNSRTDQSQDCISQNYGWQSRGFIVLVCNVSITIVCCVTQLSWITKFRYSLVFSFLLTLYLYFCSFILTNSCVSQPNSNYKWTSKAMNTKNYFMWFPNGLSHTTNNTGNSQFKHIKIHSGVFIEIHLC